MEENNNKLFVFEKKEILLIFIFVILMAIISFTLGVRTGKSLSLKNDEYSASDIKNIDLKSVDEEFVDDVVKPEMKDETISASDGQNDMEERLREEMEKLATQDIKIEKNEVEKPSAIEDSTTKEVVEKNKTKTTGEGGDFTGKYTIQLFSHQSQAAAQDFADGFLLKGYDVIINEAIIAGKGKWYRVSIGIFDDVNQAKDYLQKEKSLFQDKNYIISQF